MIIYIQYKLVYRLRWIILTLVDVCQHWSLWLMRLDGRVAIIYNRLYEERKKQLEKE